MDASTFIARFESFPREIQKRILEFAESILKKSKRKGKMDDSFKFDWEGALKSKDSAVELQHKANSWR